MIHENLLVHNSQLLNRPLSSLQLNPAVDPTPPNSIDTLVPSTTKPVFMRFTLQMEDVTGTYTLQITSSSSMSEVAITRKEYRPDGTFWNTVVLPGGPVYRCNILLRPHNEYTSYKYCIPLHIPDIYHIYIIYTSGERLRYNMQQEFITERVCNSHVVSTPTVSSDARRSNPLS